MCEKSDIKVSVIVPVYNAEAYLNETLDRLINQSLKEIEIICIDDGSTDCSLEILKKYQACDNRITVIVQEHINAGAARNRGLEIAKGEYLSFLDADDIYEQNMLESAYLAAIDNDAEIVVFRSNRLNEKIGEYEGTRWTIRDEYLPDKKVFSHKDMKNFLYCFSAGWAWDKLFLRSYIEEMNLQFQEQRWINDKFFVECALSAANRIYVLNEVLICKRVYNSGSLTSDYSDSGKSEYIFLALKAIKEQLIVWGIYEELRADYQNFCLHHILWNLDQFLELSSFEAVYNLTKKELANVDLVNVNDGELDIGNDHVWLDKIKQLNCDEYKWERSISKEKDHYNGAYLFPFELVSKNKKIILYAAGRVGQTYYRQIKFTQWSEVIMWIDMKPEGKKNVCPIPVDFNKYEYDYIIIALNDREIAKEAKEKILRRNGDVNKIIWRNPSICV